MLAEKKIEATQSMDEIEKTMSNASTQRLEMHTLKEKITTESVALGRRKKKIDEELSEIEPLLAEAKKAVGGIKAETLGEIRALRAPPETIRVILEGVLLIMGTFDTSWVSMKR